MHRGARFHNDAFTLGLQVFPGERKVGGMLLVAEARFQIRMQTIENYPITFPEEGGEEGQSADMVPMGMADEDMGSAFTFTQTPLHQLGAQFSDSGTGVDDDGFIIGGNYLDAGSVASHRAPQTEGEGGDEIVDFRANLPGGVVRLLEKPLGGGFFQHRCQFSGYYQGIDGRRDRTSDAPEFYLHLLD